MYKKTVFNLEPVWQALIIFLMALISYSYAFATNCDTYSCEENARLASQFEKSDKKLNFEFRRLVAKLSANQKTVLINEQKKWISFRDTECEKYADNACHECDFTNSFQIQKQANASLQCAVVLTNERSKEIIETTTSVLKGKEPNFSFSRKVIDQLK